MICRGGVQRVDIRLEHEALSCKMYTSYKLTTVHLSPLAYAVPKRLRKTQA